MIFVTAYDEHALDAFEVQALDYLISRCVRIVDGSLGARGALPHHEPSIEELAKNIGAVRSQLTVSERGRMILCQSRRLFTAC